MECQASAEESGWEIRVVSEETKNTDGKLGWYVGHRSKNKGGK